MPLATSCAGEAAAVLGRDQPRKDLHAAGADDEVVIAAAEALAAALDDAQAPPLAAVDRGELLEMDDAVRDAVDRPVGASRWSDRRAGCTVELCWAK